MCEPEIDRCRNIELGCNDIAGFRSGDRRRKVRAVSNSNLIRCSIRITSGNVICDTTSTSAHHSPIRISKIAIPCFAPIALELEVDKSIRLVSVEQSNHNERGESRSTRTLTGRDWKMYWSPVFEPKIQSEEGLDKPTQEPESGRSLRPRVPHTQSLHHLQSTPPSLRGKRSTRDKPG